MKRGRILIIDDSPTARASLRAALASDGQLSVVGEAADGRQARELLARTRPDLITMDVFLRAESGLDLAAGIMQEMPTPIVVVTAADPRDASLVFRAMQAGVLEVCAKLPSPTHPEYSARCARLIRTIKTLQSVPVVHRRRPAAPPEVPEPIAAPRGVITRAASPALLLLGASTGGPPILAKLLRELPRPFPIPIALVQHMVPGFVPGFASWLAEETGHPVRLVTEACPIEAGSVYLTAGDRHLVLEPGNALATSDAPPRSFHRPSIDVLFESAAASTAGQLIGVLLTGMGGDGARGLLALRRAGAHTIVQDPKSCAVASMPDRAIALDAADRVVAPDDMAAAIRLALSGSNAEAAR